MPVVPTSEKPYDNSQFGNNKQALKFTCMIQGTGRIIFSRIVAFLTYPMLRFIECGLSSELGDAPFALEMPLLPGERIFHRQVGVGGGGGGSEW